MQANPAKTTITLKLNASGKITDYIAFNPEYTHLNSDVPVNESYINASQAYTLIQKGAKLAE